MDPDVVSAMAMLEAQLVQKTAVGDIDGTRKAPAPLRIDQLTYYLGVTFPWP